MDALRIINEISLKTAENVTMTTSRDYQCYAWRSAAV